MFLIPVERDHPTRHRSYVVYTLLVANTVVGVLTIVAGPGDVYREFGFVPDDPTWVDAVTAMHLHGSFWHFLGNMFFLWMFGDNVEDVVGAIPFLGVYFLSGVAATGAHLLLASAGDVPLIGASGAISGVLGAYVVFFPRVPTDLSLVVLRWEVKSFQVTAVGAVAAWLGTQLLFGALTAVAGLEEIVGIAFWAHVGGLVAGLILGLAFVQVGFTSRYAAETHRHPLLGYVRARERVWAGSRSSSERRDNDGSGSA